MRYIVHRQQDSLNEKLSYEAKQQRIREVEAFIHTLMMKHKVNAYPYKKRR